MTWVWQGPRATPQTRLLVIAPHPDDETIASGILLQHVRAAGGRVDILLLTDGDNNPWPQRLRERRLCIGAAERARWAARRRSEIMCALEHLGVPRDCLHALGWPDLGLASLLLRPNNGVVQRVASLLAELQPNLVVMPSLADRHPDHGTAHVLTRLALAVSRTAPVQWTYRVHAPRHSGACIELEGSKAQQLNKQAALAAYASQLALSGCRLRRMAANTERFMVVPPDARVGTRLPWRPPDWLGRWLRLSLVDGHGAESWSWAHAPLRRDADGTVHLLAGDRDAPPPRFARLTLPVPSPWIFDHWGWCELKQGGGDAGAPLYASPDA